jgi:hypothetical protein
MVLEASRNIREGLGGQAEKALVPPRGSLQSSWKLSEEMKGLSR